MKWLVKNPGTETVWGYVLRSKESTTLDSYVFTDWRHAEKWMGQRIIVEAIGEYAVHAALYRRKTCCGKVTALRWGAKMLPVEPARARS